MNIDLAKDQRHLRRYVRQRIKDYPHYENYGPGDDDADIRLITLGYYLEQTGYVALVFDTRPNADCDGQWTNYIEDDLTVEYFTDWCDAIESWFDGKPVTIKLPTGKVRKLKKTDDLESIAELFGTMIRDTMIELCKQGGVQKLPLADDAFFRVEEFDGHYGWPDWEHRKLLGQIS